MLPWLGSLSPLIAVPEGISFPELDGGSQGNGVKGLPGAGVWVRISGQDSVSEARSLPELDVSSELGWALTPTGAVEPDSTAGLLGACGVGAVSRQGWGAIRNLVLEQGWVLEPGLVSELSWVLVLGLVSKCGWNLEPGFSGLTWVLEMVLISELG